MLAGVQDFVSRLEAHRIELGMSHRSFAEYVGMNHATWIQTKNGKWPCGPAFIGRVVGSRPEFARFLPTQEVAAAEHAAVTM